MIEIGYDDGVGVEIIPAPEIQSTPTVTTPAIIDSTFRDMLVLDWSPDGTRIAYGGSTGSCEPEGSTHTNDIYILDVASNTVIKTLTGPSCPIVSIDWRPDGNAILASHIGVEVWDVNTGALLSSINRGSQGLIQASWRPDGQVIAVGFSTNRTYLMSPINGDTPVSPEFFGGDAVDWNPTGTQLVTSGSKLDDYFVGISDIQSDTLAEIGHSVHFIGAVDWSPDGEKIAYGNFGGLVKVWNVTTDQIDYTFADHQSEVYDVAWSNDSERLATAGQDGTIRIYNAESGQPIEIIDVDRPVHKLDWSPDGTKLAYGNGGRVEIIPAPELQAILTATATKTPVPPFPGPSLTKTPIPSLTPAVTASKTPVPPFPGPSLTKTPIPSFPGVSLTPAAIASKTPVPPFPGPSLTPQRQP